MKVIAAVIFVVAAVAANECPTLQEIDWSIELLLKHEDCNKFYKCTYGHPVEQQCPSDLYFNLDRWECDWKENVECGDRNIPEEDRPNPEPEPEIEPEPDCESEPETPEVVPEPELEPESVPETPEVVPEPEPKPESVPETPEVVPEPEHKPEVVPEPEHPEQEVPEDSDEHPEPELPELEFLDNGCPVNPHVHWLLPHENDCNAFYYCVWGEKVLRHCSSTLHFNRKLQVCDVPWNAGCHVSHNKHFGARNEMFRRRF